MSSMSLSNNQRNELLFVGFNQDYGERACSRPEAIDELEVLAFFLQHYSRLVYEVPMSLGVDSSSTAGSIASHLLVLPARDTWDT